MSKTIKRKRSEVTKPAFKARKARKSSHAGPTVRSDALKWKDVALPDRMEDAEGFYGLEEIDDVELVKTEDGQISFRPLSVDDVIIGEGEVAGEEWAGFDDTQENTSTPSEHSHHAPAQAATESEFMAQSKFLTSRSLRKDEASSKNTTSSEKTKIPKAKPNLIRTPNFENEVGFDALEEVDDHSDTDLTAWKDLHLSHDILTAISALGFSDPTPIQRAAIPPVRDGRDVIGKAVTGSGKTLAFGIPIVERWLESKSDRTDVNTTIPTAFILAPTRELAHQLSKHLAALSKGLEQSPRIATVTGGLALVKQQRQLEHADIIIGTPGRLWEVINSSHGLIDRLKQVQFLVIDEADRLLSEGHFKEVEEILDVLDRKVIDDTIEDGEDEVVDSTNIVQPRQRQTLVFSATFHKGLQQKLASKQKWNSSDSDLLSNSQSLDYLIQKLRFQKGIKPTFVDANPASSMAENLSESILECGAMQKDLYLYSLLLLYQHQHTGHIRSLSYPSTTDKITRTLIFTNSISTVKRLVPLLTTLSLPNTTILPLHSSMPQKSRLRSLERFTSPTNPKDTTSVLIATDVAARGLDIKGVTTVIHYHVPRSADMYVHRSGRTARASSTGRSILICSPDEVAGVTRLISKIHLDTPHSQPRPKSKATGKGVIAPFYLPANLPTQLSQRVTLAQKITETSQSTSKTKSEDHWLRTAAEELGVDYEEDEFLAESMRGRRGRGGGREKKRRELAAAEETGDDSNVRRWKAELRDHLTGTRAKVDFGDGEGFGAARRGKYLAGGAVDVDKLLREGTGN